MVPPNFHGNDRHGMYSHSMKCYSHYDGSQGSFYSDYSSHITSMGRVMTFNMHKLLRVHEYN